MSNAMKALAVADGVRLGRVEQKRELMNAPAAEVVEALIHPTPEFASYRLQTLFGRSKASVIPLVGPGKLSDACRELTNRYYPGGRVWHSALRLRDLSETDRRRLVEALARRSSREWQREAGS